MGRGIHEARRVRRARVFGFVPRTALRDRRLAVAAAAGFGYVAGGLIKVAMLGLLSETIRRFAYKAQGGVGETANWGEPMFYLLMLLATPSPWTVGGALIGAGVGFVLPRPAGSGGGLPAVVHKHAVALTLTWVVLFVLSGWFVYEQWRRGRAEVARYRETTQPRITVDPGFREQLQKECEVGKAGACTFLGQMYQFGEGVAIDYPRALASYGKACEGGGWAACSSLGGMYESGQAGRADAPAALGFYKRACDAGHAVACRNLGSLRQRGAPGVPSDAVQALAALGKACDGGDGWSCYTVGYMHERAQGTRQDFARAAEFYGKACDIRYAMGCQYLGDSYAHGEGVVRDDERGRALYLEAAGLLDKECAGGDAYSCYALGTMYHQGRGVPADPRKARQLVARACSGGNSDACAALRTLP